jgi:hypothetical protein
VSLLRNHFFGRNRVANFCRPRRSVGRILRLDNWSEVKAARSPHLTPIVGSVMCTNAGWIVQYQGPLKLWGRALQKYRRQSFASRYVTRSLRYTMTSCTDARMLVGLQPSMHRIATYSSIEMSGKSGQGQAGNDTLQRTAIAAGSINP